MKKMTPLFKQSKKAQKEYNRSRRGSWNGVNPVTRTEPNPKAYDRCLFKRGGKDAEGE